MIEKVRSAIKNFNMIKSGEKIAVALSGGADSMALLDILLKLKDEFGFELCAAHFNHKIRKGEADSDEEFVREYCKNNSVELFCKSKDVLAFAEENGLGTELAARKLRYDFFSELPCDKIATAHTSSDNAETIIFNLARGSSAKGLRGIPPVRDKYIRPVIFCSGEETRNYCELKHIPFVFDSTNAEDKYTRNFIRHNIIPLLKKINPSFEDAALRAGMSLREDEEFISECCEIEFNKRFKNNNLDISDFENLPDSIKKRLIFKFLEVSGVKEPENKHINDALSICSDGGKCMVKGSAVFYTQKGLLKAETQEKTKFRACFEEISEEFLKKNKKINNLFLNNALDCDKIIGNPRIRTRMPGDKIKLSGRGVTKSLKKIYNEFAVPAEDRENLPVVCDDEGVILICGIGVAQRCAVTDQTKKAIVLKAERL